MDETGDSANSEPAGSLRTFESVPFLANGLGRRPTWILRLGKPLWMTPFRLFAASALILVPASYVAGTPLLTAMIMAYLLAITNYLVEKQKKELQRLRPVLACDDEMFAGIEHSLSHHRRGFLIASMIVGPIVMLIVNFNGPGLRQLREGGPVTPELIWGMVLAVIFWIALCQMLVIFFSNSLCFARAGANLAKIDLLDTSSLVPFARVGIRNLLIFVGGYSMIPLIFIDGAGYLPGILTSLAITLPIALLLLVMPMYNVRTRVGREKELELDRIQQAMHGNWDALSSSPISRDAGKIGFTGLVLYRQMIEDINEWPVDYPVFIRLSLYIVFPLFTWFGAALVEKLVDLML